MYFPINNRVTAKVKISTFAIEEMKKTLPAEELNKLIKTDLAINFGKEVLSHVGMENIGAVGNDYDIEYVLEEYVFTREQLREFIEKIKEEVYWEIKMENIK